MPVVVQGSVIVFMQQDPRQMNKQIVGHRGLRRFRIDEGKAQT